SRVLYTPAGAGRRGLREQGVRKGPGAGASLTHGERHGGYARSEEYSAGPAAKPQVRILEVLSDERVVELVEQGVQPRLLALVARDLEVAGAAGGLVDLDKLLRLQRGLVTRLRNFLSVRKLDGRREKGIVQAG